MAVTAKNASKCKNHWYQPFSQTSIDTLVPVADLISPNLRSSGFPGKRGQEFSPKIAYFWRSKMFLQDCIVGLGYKNTASHVCMIENFKFNHVFCNNFCNNWAKIRQCVLWIGRKFIERVVDLKKKRKIRELGVVRIVLPIHGFPIHGKFLVPKNVNWEVTLYLTFKDE